MNLEENIETIKKIRTLASINCTQEEAASALQVAPITLSHFINANQKAKEAWEGGKKDRELMVQQYS